VSNLITDAELSALSEHAQAVFREAEAYARDAVTLYDLGIARGLLMALRDQENLGDSTFDRMFKRVATQVPKEVIATIPREHTADYGKGIVVPASRATRHRR
jgi:hypothetical protein